MRWAALLVPIALLAAAMPAEGAINKPKPFDEEFPYGQGVGDGGALTLVSGRLDVDTGQTNGSFGFFDANGAALGGLDKVCWRNGVTACEERAGATLSVRVSPGGSFAVCFPSPARARLEGGHGLAIFADLAQDDDLNSFPVDRSLVAPLVDAEHTFTVLPAVPASTLGIQSLAQAPCVGTAGLSALDNTTTFTVRDGTATLATLTGKDARVLFSGQPSMPAFAPGFVVLPFTDASRAEFGPAGRADARVGLDLDRVQELFRMLDTAHAGAPVQREDVSGSGNNTEEFLAGLLNGAVLRFDQEPREGEELDLSGLRFIRFSRMDVEGTGDGLAWEGRAYLEVEDGRVVGARPIVGVWLLKMPSWSYILWALAITLAIVRIMLKPSKDSHWDEYRWVGWIATPVAWLIVFLLWDREVHAVLGASLISDSSGQFKLVIGLLQVALLGLVAFATAAPLRVGLRNGFLLAKQGTFMGLAGSIAAILGFLMGAPYLRSYVGLLLEQVMQRLG